MNDLTGMETDRDSIEPLKQDEDRPNEASSRPDGVPEKFWDGDEGAVRIDSLMKSYNELERRMGTLPSVPENPDAYDIKHEVDMLAPDPAVNARLHQAGFTQDQAQLVYDMAGEVLMPMMEEMAANQQQEQMLSRLHETFGGKEKWNELSHQVEAWGRENLSENVYEALSGSYDGIVTIHRMMSGGEPRLGRTSGPVNQTADESSLQTMMRDPKYWRDRDPAIVERVREGFRRLYPD